MRRDSKIIAFLIPSFQPGGMERVMSEIIQYISKNTSTECHLILYGKSREVFYDIPNNVKVYKPYFEFNDSLRLWMTLKTMRFIRLTAEEIKPDIVLSFGEMWNNLVLISMLGLKLSIFVSDRSSPIKSLGFVQNNLRRILYPRATGIIAQTEKAKVSLNTKIKHKNIKVIGNPVREITNNFAIKRENVIISIGRLINTKHFDRLINVFVKTEIKDWKLIIIGGDSNKQSNSIQLNNQIKKLGMEDRIILAGSQMNVDEYLLRASIFAFTSSSEGFPNVIGEAMSAGLPVIAYDCIAGPSDMIEDGKNGYLIPLFDDTAFENKLRFLVDHKSLRKEMGIYAIESIKKYSTARICEKYYNFITS